MSSAAEHAGMLIQGGGRTFPSRHCAGHSLSVKNKQTVKTLLVIREVEGGPQENDPSF